MKQKTEQELEKLQKIGAALDESKLDGISIDDALQYRKALEDRKNNMQEVGRQLLGFYKARHVSNNLLNTLNSVNETLTDINTSMEKSLPAMRKLFERDAEKLLPSFLEKEKVQADSIASMKEEIMLVCNEIQKTKEKEPLNIETLNLDTAAEHVKNNGFKSNESLKKKIAAYCKKENVDLGVNNIDSTTPEYRSFLIGTAAAIDVSKGEKYTPSRFSKIQNACISLAQKMGLFKDRTQLDRTKWVDAIKSSGSKIGGNQL